MACQPRASTGASQQVPYTFWAVLVSKAVRLVLNPVYSVKRVFQTRLVAAQTWPVKFKLLLTQTDTQSSLRQGHKDSF